MITVLAGGVGAARFLSGLVRAIDPTEVTAVVNVADDFVIHGLHVSPDLDTVTYTLAGEVNPRTGWGRRDETWMVMDELRGLGLDAWFNLGDRDLGTHLFRTTRLAEGATLSEVTAEMAARWAIPSRILPVTDDPVSTWVTLADGEEIGFQEYFVRLQHEVEITGVRFAGVEQARPAPGVVDALEEAEVIVIAPSNPVVSIGPLRAMTEIEKLLGRHRTKVVAISPIIGGRALKGPAARMLRELGEEPSVVGVARRYQPVASTLVIDTVDADRADEIGSIGLDPVITETVMADLDIASQLAKIAIATGHPE